MRSTLLDLAIDGSAGIACFGLSTLVVDLFAKGCALYIVNIGAS